MIWLPTPEQVVTGAELLASGRLKKWLKYGTQGFDALAHGRRTFLVFGPGGVGKTTLVKYLEKFESDELPIEYRVSTLREPGSVRGHPFDRVWAFPGQPDLFKNQWDRYKSSIMGMRRCVCVLCFAYGYRTLNVHHAAAAGAVQGPRAREEELSYARRTFEFLRFKKLDRYEVWTVINKQDLWWDEREDVDTYYREHYEPLVSEFRNEVGAGNFEHQKFPLCFVRSNLKNSRGRIVKEQSSDYEESLRRVYLTYFRNHVANS